MVLPPTAGSGGANFASSVVLRPSDVVLGFFLDGDNAQIPVIFGLFGRTEDVSQDAASIGTCTIYRLYKRVRPPDGTLLQTR